MLLNWYFIHYHYVEFFLIRLAFRTETNWPLSRTVDTSVLLFVYTTKRINLFQVNWRLHLGHGYHCWSRDRKMWKEKGGLSFHTLRSREYFLQSVEIIEVITHSVFVPFPLSFLRHHHNYQVSTCVTFL